MRKIFQLGLFLMCVIAVRAQSTVITATITDTDGQTWNNGTVTASFLPGPVGKYSWPGGPIPPMVSANLDGTGTFTMTLPDNSTITPVGSLWNFSICPNASSPCVVKQMAVSGATLNLSTQLSSVAAGPRFPASPSSYGYLDEEVSPIPQQGGVYWNVTTKFQRIWTGTQWQNQGGGGGCPEGTCLVNNPTATQTVMQPITSSVTTLQANVFQNQFYANLFGTGSNGIETVYGNNALCIPQGNGIPDGCTINVSPYYSLSDAPQGWKWQGNYYGGSTGALLMPSGGSAYDYRNGTFGLYFRDPSNPLGGQSGLSSRTDITQNLGIRTYIAGGTYDPTGLFLQTNQYQGGWDFQFYPSSLFTQYVGQNYEFSINNTMEDWSDGIDFGVQEIMNHHGLGDALLQWERLYCDGGILAGNSEGCEVADLTASEDPSIYAGTVTAVTPTSITVDCNQNCSAPGQDRLWVDYASASAINGNFATGEVGPQTTGTANSAIMPPQLLDTAQNFPVSTMFQLCNPAVNNGVGGAAGCTAGNQPTGIIPTTPLTISITAGSITSNVGTFTGTNALVAGQSVIVYNFTGNGIPINNQPGTIDSAGLSSSGFEVDFTNTVSDIASTGAGKSTESPTGFSPPASITLNVVAPYTGTGGDTNGLPANFCTTTGSGVTLQSSNSGAACYLPASGYLYLVDGMEYESDPYTYNATAQTVTITGMMFPHLNGVVASWGGLAGWALQDNANLVNSSSNLGVTGTIAPTYAIAGAVTSTDLYYIPQRTNEQYGDPTMGLSNPSNGNQGYGRQLYFSTAMSSISINSGIVTFSMANPPEVNGDLHSYNLLVPTISTPSNSTYSCTTCAITWLNNNVFTYTPAAPSGTTPTSGTITYNNATYSIYPAARVQNAYDPTTGKVDGVLTVYPFTAANDPILAGDAGREAHYQEIQMSGQHVNVFQYQPNQITGHLENNFSYVGFISNDGLDIDNQNSPSMYLGYGGNWALPNYSALGLEGIWESDFYLAAPDSYMFNVQAKPVVGISSNYSNFNVFSMPSLGAQDPVPGANSQDCLNYDSNYQSSTRSQGTSSGMWSFNNCPAIANVTSAASSIYNYSNVQMGNLFAVRSTTTPIISTNEVTANSLASPTVYANPITIGSNPITYYVLGVTPGGGKTLVTTATVNLSASPPDNIICMPPQPGFATYDILRGSTSTSIDVGLSATVGNGGSVVPANPNNYSCFVDNDTSTSTYSYIGKNTTGRITALTMNATNILGPTTAPTGTCSVNGAWQITQDGVITWCDAGTWTTFVGSGGTVSGSGTTGYVPLWTSTSAIGNSLLDYGITTPGTFTFGAPVAVNNAGAASQLSLTYNNNALVPGSSSTAVYGVDSSGHAVVSEDGGTAARICDATNGVCPSTSPTGSNGNPQINASGSFGADVNTIVAQSGDTIASIESACSSAPCLYKVNIAQTFTLAANHAMNGNVWVQFGPNGVWTVNGSSYTLSGVQVASGTSNNTEHFSPSGTASVTLSTLNTLNPVLWFGAACNGSTNDLTAIQDSLNATTYGQAVLPAGMVCDIGGTLTLSKSNVGMTCSAPLSRGGSIFGGTNSCALVETTAGDDAIDVHGVSGTPLVFGKFSDFAIESSVTQTGTAAGLSLSFTGGVIVEGIASADFVRSFYIHASPSYANGGFYRDDAYWTSLSSGLSSPVGFYLDSADGNAENSLTINGDGVSLEDGPLDAIAMELNGTAVNDVDVYGFNVAGGNGILVDYTGSGTNANCSDIHFINSTIDNFYNYGLEVENCGASQTGSVEFSGGWVVGGASTSSTNGAIYLLDSSGVSVNHVQIGGHSGGQTAASGVDISGGSGNSTNNNTFLNQPYALLMTNNTTGNTAEGNTINNAGSSITLGAEIENGSDYNNISNNTFVGTWATGLSIDTSSISNYFGGIQCGASVTVCVNDLNIPKNGSTSPLDVVLLASYAAPAVTASLSTAATSNAAVSLNNTSTGGKNWRWETMGSANTPTGLPATGWMGFYDQTDTVFPFGMSNSLVESFEPFKTPSVSNSAAQTVVNCSTSGTVTFSQPEIGSSYKKVVAYFNACVGTFSYTYPTAFTNTPQLLSQSITTAVITSVSTTAASGTGATTTGFADLDGY